MLATRRPPPVAPLSLAAGAPLLFALMAPRRVSLGIQQAAESRYLHFAAALILPAIAVALTDLARRIPPARAVAVIVAAACAVQGWSLMTRYADHEEQTKQAVKARVLAAATLVDSGAIILEESPDIDGAPGLSYGC